MLSSKQVHVYITNIAECFQDNIKFGVWAI